MSTYKEIVTKTVVGKGKKNFRNKYTATCENIVDTVLGCWVINHTLSGTNSGENVKINGSFDINIWYSYDNNTKTNVLTKKINYEELVRVNLKDDLPLNSNSEIILRSLKNPNCIDVTSNGNEITYIIEKEIGIEIIGDAKVKINAFEDEDDYELIEDDPIDVNEDVMDDIENEVNEDYIDEKTEEV